MWGGASRAFLLPAAAPTEATTAAPTPLLHAPLSSVTAAYAAAGASAGVQSSRAPWCCFTAALVAGAVAAKASKRRSGGIQRRAVASARAAEEATPLGVSRAGLLRGCGTVGAGGLALPFCPCPAYAKSFEDATKDAATYGLPDLLPSNKPPGGWSVICEPIGVVPDANYGKSKVGGEPILAEFYAPPLWILTKPSVDFNGSAGTLAANDFGKGDTATVFIDVGFQGKMETMKAPDFKAAIIKALSQKGKGFVYELEVSDIKDGAPGYKIFSFSYVLDSPVGFEIYRSGIASITQLGGTGNLQMLWTGVTDARFETMKDSLDIIANSFRAQKIPKGVKLEGFTQFQTLDEVTLEAGGVKSLEGMANNGNN